MKHGVNDPDMYIELVDSFLEGEPNGDTRNAMTRLREEFRALKK